MAWTILVEDHQGNIFAKLYRNRSSGFWQEDFWSFLYRYIGKISPAPWQPCFLTNHDGLNNLGRRLQKKHSCRFILKSVQWFLTRRFLKFSIQIYRENKPRHLAATFFDESKWFEHSWKRITKGTFLQNYIEIGPVVSDKKSFKVFYIDI